MSERLTEPLLKDVLSRTVQDIAAKAYNGASEAKGIPLQDVYHSGVCEIVSEVMARELTARYGENVRLMRFDKMGVGLHQFIQLAFGNERWVIDPTWQQFLPQADFVKPKVLFVPQQTLEKVLSENGISKTVQMLWLEATEVQIPKEL